MNIFKDDILKNKYFLIAGGLVLLILAYLYIKDYNSIENQCRRRYEKASSFFGSQNKLQDMALDTATEQMIEDCTGNSK